MKKSISFFLFLLLALVNVSAMADTPPSFDDVTVLSMVTKAMAPAADKLLAQSILWLGSFLGIQFFLTNFALLKSGADIEAIIGKLIGSLFWVGFCVYVLKNGPGFIGSVGNQFFNLLGAGLPSPGAIMLTTIGLVSSLTAVAAAVGIGSPTMGNLIVYILIFIFSIGMFFAMKIFMVQLELGLVVMLSPLSFSFLGLNALKDQGIAPFKALISLGYRIILTTIVLSAFTEVGNAIISIVKGFSVESIILNGAGLFVKTILSGLGAYILLAFLLYKSDAIAASLAGGSTSMGTGDVAAAAAMGASAGAAMAGSASIATKPIQSMSDVMKSMTDAGSVMNATPGMGSGGQSFNPGPPPPRPPSPSLGPTNSKGVPIAAPPPASAPPSNESAASPPSESSASGASGMDAGIGGAGSDLEKKMGQIVDHLTASKQPTMGDRLRDLNQHVAQERTPTNVSINTHHAD